MASNKGPDAEIDDPRYNTDRKATMKRILTFGLIGALGSVLHAQALNVRGRVSNGAGQPVANAVVELKQQGVKDTTGSDGAYSLTTPSVSNRPFSATAESMRLDNCILGLTVGKTSSLKVDVFDIRGALQKKASLP